MILRVLVQPRAKRNRLAGLLREEWKLQLTAPPIEGRANAACIEFLARGLRIARSRKVWMAVCWTGARMRASGMSLANAAST